MTTLWEYRIVKVNAFLGVYYRKKDGPCIPGGWRDINELFSYGWEMFAVVAPVDGGEDVGYFKRAISDEEPS